LTQISCCTYSPENLPDPSTGTRTWHTPCSPCLQLGCGANPEHTSDGGRCSS